MANGCLTHDRPVFDIDDSFGNLYVTENKRCPPPFRCFLKVNMFKKQYPQIAISVIFIGFRFLVILSWRYRRRCRTKRGRPFLATKRCWASWSAEQFRILSEIEFNRRRRTSRSSTPSIVTRTTSLTSESSSSVVARRTRPSFLLLDVVQVLWNGDAIA